MNNINDLGTVKNSRYARYSDGVEFCASIQLGALVLTSIPPTAKSLLLSSISDIVRNEVYSFLLKGNWALVADSKSPKVFMNEPLVYIINGIKVIIPQIYIGSEFNVDRMAYILSKEKNSDYSNTVCIGKVSKNSLYRPKYNTFDTFFDTLNKLDKVLEDIIDNYKEDLKDVFIRKIPIWTCPESELSEFGYPNDEFGYYDIDIDIERSSKPKECQPKSNSQSKERISWNKYFMEIAKLTAKRSSCLRRQVGAVLVKDRHIIATGYNGSPAGTDNCSDLGTCLRQELNVPSGERHELCRAVHAEMNAITQCAVNGTSLRGAELYTTTSPCSLCMKLIANAGIKKVYIYEGYPDELSNDIAEQAGIDIEIIS